MTGDIVKQPGRTQVSRRAERRDQIIEAAIRVFAREGLQSASISGICREARVSPGHLYHYFDSKEAIVAAITETYLGALQAHFETLPSSGNVASTIANELAKAMERSQNHKLALFFEMIAHGDRNPQIAVLIERSTKLTGGLIADLVRKGQERGEVKADFNAADIAVMIMGMIDAVKTVRMRHSNEDISHIVAMMSTMITGFLSTDPS